VARLVAISAHRRARTDRQPTSRTHRVRGRRPAHDAKSAPEPTVPIWDLGPPRRGSRREHRQGPKIPARAPRRRQDGACGRPARPLHRADVGRRRGRGGPEHRARRCPPLAELRERLTSERNTLQGQVAAAQAALHAVNKGSARCARVPHGDEHRVRKAPVVALPASLVASLSVARMRPEHLVIAVAATIAPGAACREVSLREGSAGESDAGRLPVSESPSTPFALSPTEFWRSPAAPRPPDPATPRPRWVGAQGRGGGLAGSAAREPFRDNGQASGGSPRTRS
jgi:hypothetical protein